MVTYIYFVKCPNCEDEHFDFFDDAKAFALGCLSQKPIITQTEVCRNDFGECTDHSDLGTIWSWEDECNETEAEPAKSVFTKDDLKQMADGKDPEFDDDDFYFNNGLVEDVLSEATQAQWPEIKKLCDEIGIIAGEDIHNFMKETGATYDNLLGKLKEYRDGLGSDFEIKEARKPIPEGMTIEQLVEAMEENEDTVECAGCEELFPKDECFHKEGIGYLCGDCEDRIVKCTWCDDLYDKSECRYEVDLGWLCDRCEAAIKSRGETLTFREGNYWDFLDEDIEKPVDEDLEWHTYKITFSTKANPDKEQTTTFKTWQSDVEYAWRMSNTNIPHTTIKNIELIEGLSESWDPKELVEFEYEDFNTTLTLDQLDVDVFDEVDYASDFTYKVTKEEVATDIYENFLTDEDVADIPGGLEALSDDDALWQSFIEEHFDSLLEKYYDKLKDFYEDAAIEAFDAEAYDRYRQEEDDAYWDEVDRRYQDWKENS
jgi:hypothetical protein